VVRDLLRQDLSVLWVDGEETYERIVEFLDQVQPGLVAKVKRKQLSFGEGWEEAMRLAFLVEGDKQRAETVAIETIWANPESRIVAETVDAAVKLASIGVPRPALWEYIGASPQQVARWREEGEPKGAPPTKETIQVAATPEQAVAFNEGNPIPPTPPPSAPVKPPAPPPPTGGKRG